MTNLTRSHLPLDQCLLGHVYRLSSRNLVLGVFNGDTGFVGIREKFGSEYLFTEYHWDTGPPFGTACPTEELGVCPIVDLAEGHSDGKLYRTNQPLFEWLKIKESESARTCTSCGKPFHCGWPDVTTCWNCL